MTKQNSKRMKEISNRIENLERELKVKKPNCWAFMIVRKKSKRSVPEDWKLQNVENPSYPRDQKTFLAFKSRRAANRWVKYWQDGEEIYDVIAVPLKISPLGKLIV